MQISTSSWHFKLVDWHCGLFNGRVENRCPDLCSYMRRLTIWIPLTLIGILILHIIHLPFSLLALMVGGRPGLVYPLDIKEYSGLYIKGIPFDIYPWHVILPAVVIFGEVYGGLLVGLTFFKVEGIVILCCAVIAALVVGIVRYFHSDTKHLVDNWVEAKTKRFCPTVEYVNETDKTDE